MWKEVRDNQRVQLLFLQNTYSYDNDIELKPTKKISTGILAREQHNQ